MLAKRRAEEDEELRGAAEEEESNPVPRRRMSVYLFESCPNQRMNGIVGVRRAR